MSKNYINENLLDASPMKKQKDEAKILVNKWEKTGLLDGLNEDFKKSGMAVMLENQARQLITEASTTNPTSAKDEEWSGVALPLVRRVFGEIAAQEFVSVQPMNLPSGLVLQLQNHLVVKLVLTLHQVHLLHLVLMVFMVLGNMGIPCHNQQ